MNSSTVEASHLSKAFGAKRVLHDLSFGVSPGDVIETVGRLATSIVWVPLQKLAGKKLPADGADVCYGRLEDAVR